MEICRACLLTEKEMVALDEFCVTSYTLLTNLKVTIGDEKPQFLCENCFNMIKVFIDFREKAITSDAMLQDISENTKHEIITKVENEYDDDYTLDCEENYAFNDEANNSISNNIVTYNEENVTIAPVEKTNLQCVLCQKQFTDSITLMDHLREHKRGAKCKLCLIKVPLADLPAHTLHHIQHMEPPEQVLESKQIKLEVPEEYEEPYLDVSSADFENIHPDSVKVEKKENGERKRKSVSKCKKKVKTSGFLEQNLLHCGLCTLKFDCKELLTKHLESHKSSGTSTCKLCHEVCSSWPQLFGHRFLHLPPKQRHCHKCGRRCFNENNMEFHYRSLHYDGEDKSLKCKHCLRSYANSRKLSKHIRAAHGMKRYICDHCNKSYPNKPQLISHLASHGGGPRYVCDICGFSTKLKNGLKRHKMVHYPDKIICRICERIFLDQAKADEHKLICKPRCMICPECGKQFSRARLLKRHLISHTSTKTYKCGRCPATFRWRQTLKVHLDRHDNNRTQRCELCGASFYSQSVLIKHRRVHTGEKPYVCKICHRGFTGNHNLKVHMRIHGEDLIVKRNMLQIEDILLGK